MNSDDPGVAKKRRGKVGRMLNLVKIKLIEWVTAVRLERRYTKDEIMMLYMNKLDFGNSAFGIRAAAMTYFGKSPIDLTVEEAATILGIINKTSRYNPVRNPDESFKRRNFVMGQMVKAGYLTQEQKDSLAALPIVLSYSRQDHHSGLGLYFKDMLLRTMNAREPKRNSYYFKEDYIVDSLQWANDPLYGWLNKNFKPDGSKYNLFTDGLCIRTTINSKMQKYAEEAVAEHLGKDLQKSFWRDIRYKKNKPFSDDIDKETVESLMKQARRWSDRYRMMKADVIINGVKIRMRHPGGGVSKYRSRSIQNTIDSMSSGNKPKLIAEGHYHKSYYCIYRNVHALLVPALCFQSQFMERKDVSNVMGFYDVDIYADDKGDIQYITPREHLFSESQVKKDDFRKTKRLVIK